MTSNNAQSAQAPRAEGRTAEEIRGWLVSYLSTLLDTPKERIDVSTTFEHHGLDSLGAVAMLSDMARWYGEEVSSDLLDQDASIASLAQDLAAPGT